MINIYNIIYENAFPFIAISLYFNYPKTYRINSTLLFYLSVLHNSALTIFSAWTFYNMCTILQEHGIVLKANFYFQDEKFRRTMMLFYWSKYYEFFDTFLIYLKGREPIMLQKYHHVGAVLCWHLAYTQRVDCIWIPSIANAFIHTLMYFYYLGTILRISQVRFIRQYLTTLQLIQQISTMTLCNYYYTPPNESYKNYCIIIFTNCYNTYLIYLFGKFYLKNYIKK